ncbi:MAG: type VI secretion system-associated protein TagF [Planctomycetes bacterium]|nr:type VI secretion system-associated protein TagF [Planctomycetota bacterium]
MIAPRSFHFGKLPQHGDFLAPDRASAAAVALDAWLHGGMDRLRELDEGSWGARYDGLPPTRFAAWPKESNGPLVGALFASRDKVERRHPFVAGLAFEQSLSAPCWTALPLATSDHLDALELLGIGDAKGSLDEQRRLLTGLAWSGADLDDPAQQLGAALGRLSTEILWRPMRGAQQPGRRAVCLLDFAASLSERFPPRFVLRVPITPDPISLGFWLRLTAALAPRGQRPQLVAWGPTADGSRSVLRLLFDELQPRYFPAVMFPDRDDRFGFDLDYTTVIAAQRRSDAERRFGELTARPGTCDQLLRSVERAAQR